MEIDELKRYLESKEFEDKAKKVLDTTGNILKEIVMFGVAVTAKAAVIVLDLAGKGKKYISDRINKKRKGAGSSQPLLETTNLYDRTIVDKIRRANIKQLYHFTNIKSLCYIKKCNGLLCKDKLYDLDLLDKIQTGGDKTSWGLDGDNNNWDKISLGFTPYSPFMTKLKQNSENLCCICIDVTVAGLKNVWFTDTNATKSDHKRGRGLDGLNLVDLGKLNNCRSWDEWKKISQAEILVPDFISTDYFQHVVFKNSQDLKMGIDCWETDNDSRFVLDPDKFLTRKF